MSAARTALLAAVVVAAALPATAEAGRRADAAWQPTWPADAVAAEAAPAAPTAGSIYGGAGGGGLKLFHDSRARDPGDIVTVVLTERTTAQSRASTQVVKDSDLSIAPPSLFGIPLTYKGTPIIGADLAAGRTFNGDGDSSQSNRLNGEITATVVGRLANGNLVIRGEKRIRLNQGDETVRIQGVVRAADIGPDNRIASSRVADAQIVYGGRGPVSKSNAMGWLSRFFNSSWMPM